MVTTKGLANLTDQEVDFYSLLSYVLIISYEQDRAVTLASPAR